MTQLDPHRLALLEHAALDLTWVRGEGAWLTCTRGRRVLDLTGQYGAVPLGHGAPEVWAAIDRFRAAGAPALVQPSRPDRPAALAARLAAVVPVVGDRSLATVRLLQSGSEGVEAAVALARAATGRALVVGLERGYHGHTLAAAALTWRTAEALDPGVRPPGFTHLPPDDLGALEALFAARGHEVAALVLEPVQGEGGVWPLDPAWARRARALCDAHGALLVLDEVQTGLGRTGAWFGAERLGVPGDVVVVSKALGGGLVPLAAVVARAGLEPAAFALGRGSTFANGELTCAVGLAVLDALDRDDAALVRRAGAQGERARAALEATARRHPGAFRAVRGVGLMLAVELEPVGADSSFLLAHADRTGGLPAVCASYLLHGHGVRVIPGQGGARVLRLLPPLTLADDELDLGLAAFDALAATLAARDWGALLRPLLRARAGRLDTRADPPACFRPDDRPVRAPAAAPAPDHRTGPRLEVGPPARGRFAFLIHPTSTADLLRSSPGLATLTPDELRLAHAWSAARPDHAPICHLPRLRGATGAEVEGWLLTVALSPETARRDPEAAAREVGRAAETARALGAQVLGLGAFTSIVTRNGDALPPLPLAVTTGNALTVAAAVDGLTAACAAVGLDLAAAEALVLGLGACGSATAELLAERVGRLVLCGHAARGPRDARRAQALLDGALVHAATGLDAADPTGVARALARLLPGLARLGPRGRALRQRLLDVAAEAGPGPADARGLAADARGLAADARGLAADVGGHPGRAEGLATDVAWAARALGLPAPVAWTLDRARALAAAEVVVTATSDPEPVVFAGDLRPGAVVCDVARPADVAADAEQRPDVLVFDGGLCRLPEDVAFGQHLGLPDGVALACLTETIVLALEGVTAGRFGRPRALAQEARAIRAAAARQGVALAGLHRGGGPIDAGRLATVAQARAALAARERTAAA